MKPNPILTEIRQAREDLARESNYDLRRLFEYVRECEREATKRGVKFVLSAPREIQTDYSLREESPGPVPVKKRKGNAGE